MRVRLRLFASFAQIAGFRELELELPEAARAADALAALRRGPLIALPLGSRPLIAVNRRQVLPDHLLSEGDEVAIFPPVSGGSGHDGSRILVTEAVLDPRKLAESVRAYDCGALVMFEGTVRDHNRGEAVTSVTYEAHEEMARDLLQQIVHETEARWPRVRVALAHRVGRLVVGETSVVIVVAAPHRRQAFAACRLAMDRIKESLPTWKSEEGASGELNWL